MSNDLSNAKRYLNACKSQQQRMLEQQQEVQRAAAARKQAEKRKIERHKMEEAAASRLQAFFRSYFTRKAIMTALKVWQQREEVTDYLKQGLRVELWKLKQQCHDLQFKEGEQGSAATRIQAFWRGVLAKRLAHVLRASRLVEETRQQVHYAATLINAGARGRLGRRIWKELWTTVQETRRIEEEARQREREIHAAEFMQRVYRGFAARRDARRLREAKSVKPGRRRSAIKIQVRRRSVESNDDHGGRMDVIEEESTGGMGRKAFGTLKEDRARRIIKPSHTHQSQKGRGRSGSIDPSVSTLEGSMSTHEANKAFEDLYDSAVFKIISQDAKLSRRLDLDTGASISYAASMGRDPLAFDGDGPGLLNELFSLPVDDQ